MLQAISSLHQEVDVLCKDAEKQQEILMKSVSKLGQRFRKVSNALDAPSASVDGLASQLHQLHVQAFTQVLHEARSLLARFSHRSVKI